MRFTRSSRRVSLAKNQLVGRETKQTPSPTRGVAHPPSSHTGPSRSGPNSSSKLFWENPLGKPSPGFLTEPLGLLKFHPTLGNHFRKHTAVCPECVLCLFRGFLRRSHLIYCTKYSLIYRFTTMFAKMGKREFERAKFGWLPELVLRKRIKYFPRFSSICTKILITFPPSHPRDRINPLHQAGKRTNF